MYLSLHSAERLQSVVKSQLSPSYLPADFHFESAVDELLILYCSVQLNFIQQ